MIIKYLILILIINNLAELNVVTNGLIISGKKLTGTDIDHRYRNEQNDQHQQQQQQRPQQQQTQIVQLKALNLTEELKHHHQQPHRLFDFRTYLNQNELKQIKRLQIMPMTTTQPQQQSMDINTNQSNSIMVSTESLSTKFKIDSTYQLYANSSFDREQLIASNQCEDITDPSQLDLSNLFINKHRDALTHTPTLDCVLKLKIAAYDENNNLIKIFILPILINDINDKQPEFRHTLYRVNISENLLSKSIIPLDAPIDSDSSRFGIQECQIENNLNIEQQTTTTSTTSTGTIQRKSGNLFEAFFNRNTQRLFLIVNAPLDRENRSQYDLVLMCTDGGAYARTRLHIDVLDANDNVPFFKSKQQSVPYFNASIYEHHSIADGQKQQSVNGNHSNNDGNNKEHLIQIEAFDHDDTKSPNGQLVYSLPFELNQNELVNELFHIDETDGRVSVRRDKLDYEKQKKYTLKVKVQDKGANPVPIYTDLHVNVLDHNDNPPNGHFTFVEKYLMKQDKLNNTIWIYEELDYKQKSITLAYLTLTDADSALANGHSLSASLIGISYLNQSNGLINQQDVGEGQDKSNEATFKLVQIIKDYDNLYYALQLNNRIDREQVAYYDLTFRLNDNSASSTNQQLTNNLTLRIILLDINDNRPEFGVKDLIQLNLTENQLVRGFFKLNATDLDLDSNGLIDYKLVDDGNGGQLMDNTQFVSLSACREWKRPTKLFKIDSLSLLSQIERFDRETCGQYLFKVRAFDQGTPQLYNDLLILLNINDQNDNLPMFQVDSAQFDLNENERPLTLIGQVKAIDLDLNPSTGYLIEPNEMSSYFRVDNQTGNLLTTQTIDADDSKLNEILVNNSFHIRLVAIDLDLNQSKSTINLTIHLNDLNDNGPLVIDSDDSPIDHDLNNKHKVPIVFNLINKTNCSCHESLDTIRSIDLDRDFNQQNEKEMKHLFKFGFIRRMSWQFVFEIVKNQLEQNDSNLTPIWLSSSSSVAPHPPLPNKNKTNQRVLEYLQNLVNLEKNLNIKPISNVNLRKVFQLEQNDESSNTTTTTTRKLRVQSATLMLNQMCQLNWGIYNFSILIIDNSSIKSNTSNDSFNYFKTEYAMKMLVFNLSVPTETTELNKTEDFNGIGKSFFQLSKDEISYLSYLIDLWWIKNSGLVASYKKRIDLVSSIGQSAFHQTNNNNNNAPLPNKKDQLGEDQDEADDNGDDIDSLTQEYYKFYAASAFARGTLLLPNGNMSLANGGSVGFLHSAKLFLFNNSSNAIILLISLFVFIALILISLITYKHYKTATSLKEDNSSLEKHYGTASIDSGIGKGGYGKRRQQETAVTKKKSNGSYLSNTSSSRCVLSTNRVCNNNNNESSNDKMTSVEKTSNSIKDPAKINRSYSTNNNNKPNKNFYLKPTSVYNKEHNLAESETTSSVGTTNSIPSDNLTIFVYPSQGQPNHHSQHHHHQQQQRQNNSSSLVSSKSTHLSGTNNININSSNSSTTSSSTNSEQIKRYIQSMNDKSTDNEENSTNSVCDSFTIITSLAAADCSSLIATNQNMINQHTTNTNNTNNSRHHTVGSSSSSSSSASTTSSSSSTMPSGCTSSSVSTTAPIRTTTTTSTTATATATSILVANSNVLNESSSSSCSSQLLSINPTFNASNPHNQQSTMATTFLSTFIPMSASQQVQQQQQQQSLCVSNQQPITTTDDLNGTDVIDSPPITNDLGYYGSSDYSDNTSYAVSNSKYLIQKQPSLVQHRIKYSANPNSERLSYANCNNATSNNNANNNCNGTSSSTKIGTNSSSSFTSSSLLSSPTSSSSTDSSSSPLFNSLNTNSVQIKPQSAVPLSGGGVGGCGTGGSNTTTPIITNLYPFNIYNSSNKKTIINRIDSATASSSGANLPYAINEKQLINEISLHNNKSIKSNHADVKVYLERFERIYNSDNLDLDSEHQQQHQQPQRQRHEQHEQQIQIQNEIKLNKISNTSNTFNKSTQSQSQRTSLAAAAAYSYV